MHGLRFLVAAALSATVVACQDDDDDDGGAESTGAPASTGTTMPASSDGMMTTAMPTDDSTTAAPPDTSTGMPPMDGTSSGPGQESGSSGDTGPSLEGEVLQNDSWTPADSIVWQEWPNQEDCWASVFQADASQYPFEIVGAIAAIGDAKGTFEFGIGVWAVDNMGMPETELASSSIAIDGATGDLTEIDFATLGLTLDPVEMGDFAIVMCHTEHMGQPTIAIDTDGTITEGNNWVFQQAMGEWVEAQDFFGIDGDFILRAVIQPQA